MGGQGASWVQGLAVSSAPCNVFARMPRRCFLCSPRAHRPYLYTRSGTLGIPTSCLHRPAHAGVPTRTLNPHQPQPPPLAAFLSSIIINYHQFLSTYLSRSYHLRGNQTHVWKYTKLANALCSPLPSRHALRV